MDFNQTRIEVRQDHSKAVIKIGGRFSSSAESGLRDAFERAASGGIKTVLLDFSGLEYMNSSGVGLLVTLLVHARKEGVRLLAFGLTEHYRRLLELTRINEIIGLYDTEAEALAALASEGA